MASRTTAASAAVRVIGPTWSRLHDNGRTPRALTSPYVGFNPTIPQNDAGMRTEPAVSVPMAAKQSWAETATADPEEEPPAVWSRSQGLRAIPKAPITALAP